MSIVTLRFFIFAAVACAEYWLCPRRGRWVVLLIASGIFWLVNTSLSLGVCAVFAGEVLLTWLAALAVRKISGEWLRTAVTAGTVILLTAALILYKDLLFFVGNINAVGSLLGRSPGLTLPQWLAPFGISYFTLILIAYLLDVRWGTVEEPEKNPLKMLLFAGYFPQMTSGPITRYNDMTPTLFGGATWSWKGFCFGCERFLWGLFKKLVVADRMAVVVATLYDGTTYTGWWVPVAAVAYIGQLYADFGGCMDIVIGISEMFGVPLAENFRRPFAATNLSELWRRWHITLGVWVRDYIMYPVLKSGWMKAVRGFCKKRFGKKASREVPTYIGMFITWFCVGFWHGGSWKYIFGSGLFFFAMIAGGMLLEPVFKKLIALLRINTGAWSWKFFQQVRSFALFAAAVSFDRRSSFGAGVAAWKSVLTTWNPGALRHGAILQLGLSGVDLVICAVGFLAILVVSMLQERRGSVRELLLEQNRAFRWLVYLALLGAVLVLGCYGPDWGEVEFIYANF